MKKTILIRLGAFLMLLFATRANAQITYVIDSVVPISSTSANLYLSYSNHKGTTMLSPRYDTSMALTRLEPAQYLTPLDTNGQLVILLDSCVVGGFHYARVTYFGDSAGFNFTNIVTFSMACNPVSVSDNMPAVIIINQPVSANATALGGVAPYTYSVAGLMTNVVINSATGVYGGSANVQASSTYTLFAIDADGCSASFVNSVNSICGTQTITSTLPTTLVAGLSVSGNSVATSGGIAPYTYGWSGINSISLSSAGNFSGAALVVGPQTYTVSSIDSAACQATGVFTTTVSCASATLSVTMPSTLLVGDTVAGYSALLQGGIGQVSYNWSGGTMTGVNLDPLSGAFTGTVMAPGVYTYTVTGVDSLNCPTSIALTTTVTCPTPTFVSTLPALLQVGNSYTATVSATGQNSPFTYAWGNQPAGLGLFNNTVVGTVTAAGTSVTTYTVTDTYGCQSVFTYTYVANCPAITIQGIPDDTVGTSILHVLAISGGTAPYSVSISGLPPVWTSSNDTISGTSNAIGVFTPTITVMDAYGCQATLLDTVQIFCNAWTTTGIADGITGIPYADTLKSTDPSVTYSLIAGQVPTGTILQTNGAVTGTPTQAGTYIYTVSELNQYGCVSNFTDTVIITCPTLTITSTLPSTLYPGQTPSASATAIGGIAPYSWLAFTGNSVPSLTLTPAGLIVGSVTQTGVYTYTYNVVDANNCPGTLSATTTVLCSNPVVTSPFPDTIGIGTALNYTITATDSLTASFTYTVTGNFLPGGVVGTNGAVSGTVNQFGTFIFTLVAISNYSCVGTVTDTVVVLCDTLAINSLQNNWIIGVAGSYTMSGVGGTPPFTWSVAGLPANLSLTDSTISGIPALNGIYPVVITRSDFYGCQVVLFDTIVVDSLLWIHLDSIASITSNSALAYLSYRDNNDPLAYAYVGYGISTITTNLPNQSLPLGDGQLVFSITGLLPGTTYIAGGRAVDAPSGLIFSNNLTFTTKPTGPLIITTNVSNILPNSATIAVQVNAGGANTTVKLYCGNNPMPSTLYTQTISVSGTLYFNVSGLAAASTAYYYAIALSAWGTDTTQIMSFNTSQYNVQAVLLSHVCTGSKVTAIANVYSNDPGCKIWLLYEQGAQLTAFASQTVPTTIGITSGTVAVSSPTLPNFQQYAFAVRIQASNGLQKTTDTAVCQVTEISELEALESARVWSFGKTVRVLCSEACEFTLTDVLGATVLVAPVGRGSEESFMVATPGIYIYSLKIGDYRRSAKIALIE